jgi:hypothetical protein
MWWNLNHGDTFIINLCCLSLETKVMTQEKWKLWFCLGIWVGGY